MNKKLLTFARNITLSSEEYHNNFLQVKQTALKTMFAEFIDTVENNEDYTLWFTAGATETLQEEIQTFTWFLFASPNQQEITLEDSFQRQKNLAKIVNTKILLLELFSRGKKILGL